jgi:UDPglucose 6-dehydrogenase
VRAYDPVAMDAACVLLPGVTMCDDAYAAAEGADAVLLVTEWAAFRRIDFRRLHATMRRPVLIDGRNLYDAAELRAVGFIYDGVGLPSVPARTETPTDRHRQTIRLTEMGEELSMTRIDQPIAAD